MNNKIKKLIELNYELVYSHLWEFGGIQKHPDEQLLKEIKWLCDEIEKE